MIAVSIPTDNGAIRICGDCVLAAAALVMAEQNRRTDDDAARNAA
jgi:hypothetical protein